MNTRSEQVSDLFSSKGYVRSSYEHMDSTLLKYIDSVLAFKKRNNLGRFNDATSDVSASSAQNHVYEEAAKSIKLGDRCEVDVGGASLKRRGTVRFIGKAFASRSEDWRSAIPLF